MPRSRAGVSVGAGAVEREEPKRLGAALAPGRGDSTNGAEVFGDAR